MNTEIRWEEVKERGKKISKGQYFISENGELYGTFMKKIQKPQICHKGYAYIEIGKKKFKIHRLVAKYFIQNPEDKPQVNHKDGNKLNNNVSNLEWVTNKENYEHAMDKGLFSKEFLHYKGNPKDIQKRLREKKLLS